MTPEFDCSGCVAACCRTGTIIQLTPKEKKFLEKRGTRFNTLLNPGQEHLVTMPKGDPMEEIFRNVPEGYGVYEFTTDCGYVVKKEGWLQCGAFTDLGRPGACFTLVIGSRNCLKARGNFGLVSPDDIK